MYFHVKIIHLIYLNLPVKRQNSFDSFNFISWNTKSTKILLLSCQRFFKRKLSQKFWSKWVIDSFSVNFFWNLKEKKYYLFGRSNYFFQKQCFYLTSIALLHFQRKIIVFCAKYWPIFFNYKICIWCKESIFCRKKWNISKKKYFHVHFKRYTKLSNKDNLT